MNYQDWCGMTAQTGSVLSGAFTILATCMYLIFEHKQLKKGSCTEISLLPSTTDLLKQFIICWAFTIILFLSVITIIISGYLIYSVYAKIHKGLVIYVIWIIFYEIMNIVVQVLTNHFSVKEARVMRWFGLVSRIFMHCFCMYFIISYAYIKNQSQQRANILFYRRPVSVGNRVPTSPPLDSYPFPKMSAYLQRQPEGIPARPSTVKVEPEIHALFVPQLRLHGTRHRRKLTDILVLGSPWKQQLRVASSVRLAAADF
ncbi:transmembrane protein 217-like [Ctenodactylus gundi]